MPFIHDAHSSRSAASANVVKHIISDSSVISDNSEPSHKVSLSQSDFKVEVRYKLPVLDVAYSKLPFEAYDALRSV